MARVGGIIWNRFSGFPQLAGELSLKGNTLGLESFHLLLLETPGKCGLLLTSAGELTIVPVPPQGGIFDFQARDNPQSLLTTV
ncbi:hypothetical protein F3P66_12375 [Agrobacterium fabrum]|uniref:Uncharacterized protein n=1 Tax=Agrobacterium fabrum (strain C58 / ATCC 33970) TaxID=176299 RepID=Q7D1H3_AGRFC|nr:hypothetical protein Atu0427 [Agrobacterium fabrum str. C58]QRM60140.1 hypothetical protein F3P66_12375 [Agrobacterium fabrum]TRB31585.1 hypothetical protein EXN51_05530 [Agrobacterium fabrum]